MHSTHPSSIQYLVVCSDDWEVSRCVHIGEHGFAASQNVIFKLNDIQLGVREVANGRCNQGFPCPGHVFIKALWVDFGVHQIIIRYPNVGDCKCEVRKSSILWLSQNLVLHDRDVLDSCTNSLREINAFEEEDENIKFESPMLPRSHESNGLLHGMPKLLESKEISYLSRPEWHHKIHNLVLQVMCWLQYASMFVFQKVA